MSRAPRHAPYARFAGSPGTGGESSVLRLGLRPLADDDWLERDGCVPAAARAKHELLARSRDEVFRALPGSEDGQREVEALVVEFVRGVGTREIGGAASDAWTDDSPDGSPDTVLDASPDGSLDTVLDDSPDGSLDTVLDASPDGSLDTSPLVRAGLRVADDLCLLERRDGRYVLTAGFVCTPSHWRLADKIGLPVLAIHAPVPGYAERIGTAVDRIIDSLAPARAQWRTNWAIAASPEPFRPARDAAELARLEQIASASDRPSRAAAALRSLYVRVERQSLRRLPRTGAVVFTIRVHIDALAAVVGDRQRAAGLRAAVAGLSAAEADYKGIAPVRRALLECLDDATGL